MNYRDTMKINAAGHLEIGGCDCVELVRQYGTPLYVMDEEYVRSVCRAFKQTIEKTYGSGNMAYASKAFSCKAIYNVMKQEKTFIDVVSGGEIYTAASVGFDMSGAFFHGNNKTDGELELAMRTGVGTIVIDAADDAERIDALARRFEKVQNVLVRVNPGVEAHTHSYIQTAKVDSKFGFSVSSGAATTAIKDVLSRKSLHFSGLHCHIGSQIFDRSAFALAVDVMTDYMRELAGEGIEVETLNMGGGFGVHYTEEDPKYNVDEYCDYVSLLTRTLCECVERKNLKKPFFVIEPGRAVVGEAGVTLYSVGAVKDIPGVRKYVAVDGGMTDNIRPALYEAKYEAVLANRANDKAKEKVSIAGKCCESGDIIIKDICLPEAKRGDLIAVFTTGAYCYSMASNYNRNAVPPVVFVRGGKSGYAVKPQTYEDIARLDAIPQTE